MKLYHLLVNRRIGITQRYHKVHDGTTGAARIVSYFYLLWINFAYYFLFFKWLGKPFAVPYYEEKRLPVSKPESSLFYHETPEKFAEKLLSYDVISFDIFDTLIFRPFSEPADLFYIVGEKLGCMDFKRIRMEAEHRARMRKFEREESFEVNLSEIWEEMEKMTGIPAARGMKAEIETEMNLCYANPYMLRVFRILAKEKKRIVMTSDMYLTGDILNEILTKNGYRGYEKIFVSCEIQRAKGDGKLFRYVRQSVGEELSCVHIGDHKFSDVKMAKKTGIAPVWYPNVNTNTILYRAYDISPIIGGAYRGLVNNRIYEGSKIYSRNYEYGYIYGGLFIVGYCAFIHRYCESHQTDRILFIARDGEVIQKVYQMIYPDEKTEYVYLSRLVAAKLTAGYFKYDYIRKMIRHKAGQNHSLDKVLEEMEVPELREKLADFVPERIQNAQKKGKRGKWKPIRSKDLLTYANLEDFIEFVDLHWEEILAAYSGQREAAGKWYRDIVKDAQNAVAVDIGWAGSGALALKTLFEKEWNIPCRITGLIAGSNSIHSPEPEMSESMYLDGDIVPYLYSSTFNRDLWKKHSPAQMYNIYFELLTSSVQPSFQGFYPDEDGKPKLRFQKSEGNAGGVKQIQEGILDFAKDYLDHFGKMPFMFQISGRDAYAPMLIAASYKETYLRHINKEFHLSIGVNG